MNISMFRYFSIFNNPHKSQMTKYTRFSNQIHRTFSDAPEEIDLDLIEMQYNEVVEELGDILAKLKFGSLTPDMIEDLEVRAYGDVCMMVELAQVIPKNDKTALLNIYDPSVLDDVKTALDLCDLDLAISKDPQGFLISLANANSKDARLQFAAGVKQKGQDYLQKLRDIRGDEIKEVKALSDVGGFGEDYLYQAEEEIHNMYLEAKKNVETAVTEKLASVGL
jgi:ribosome recycling factor